MKTNSTTHLIQRFAAMLFMVSVALFASHANALWEPLPVAMSCFIFDADDNSVFAEGDDCPAILNAARQSCNAKQGIFGRIGKRAVCKTPDTVPNANAVKGPSGSPAPWVPTPTEAAQFKKWEPPTKAINKAPPKPEPTNPGDPAAKANIFCANGARPPCPQAPAK
jgi:hypothetical protein